MSTSDQRPRPGHSRFGELRRRPGTALVVVIAVAFSCLVGGLGAAIGAQLFSSAGALFAEARTPHLVQMHAGPVDRAAIDRFAAGDPRITEHAVSEIVGIDGASLALTPGSTEASTTIEYSAATQNPSFDILMDTTGKPAHVAPGEIGIPVDIAQSRGIHVGDPLTISRDGAVQEYRVATTFRDSMMNSDLASSRRLLVNEQDIPRFRELGTGSEYLILFRLTDPSLAGKVYDDYLAAGLPSNGPNLDLSLLRIMTMMSDGITAAAVFVIAGLLTLIAALVVSLTIRTSVAAQLREIGVLRAIGIPRPALRRTFLGGHLVLLALGTLVGTVGALALAPVVTSALRARLGGAFSWWTLPAIAVVGASAMAGGLLLARLALRPALRKPPLDVMRETTKKPKARKARKSGHGPRRQAPAWWLLGRTEIRRAPGDHAVIAGLLFAAVLMVAVPLGLRATVDSPNFARSAGISVADLRIDLRHDAGLASRLDTVERALASDPRIARHTTLETARLLAQAPDGSWTGINVESGDHTMFPLSYITGRAPGGAGEIALSELNAKSFEKKVGEELVLDADGRQTPVQVVGVYRDITNGGRTAKSVLPASVGDPLWTVVQADLTPGADKSAVVDHYAALAAPARVTDIEHAQQDVMGGIHRSATVVAEIAFAGALLIVALIAVLVLRLFLVRAGRRRALAQAIGAPLASLRAGAQLQLLAPAAVGIVLGAALAPLFTFGLLALVGAMFGASGLTIELDPWRTWVLVPLSLLAVVVAITYLAVRRLDPSFVAATVAGQEE